jgi:hypothetical protein
MLIRAENGECGSHSERQANEVRLLTRNSAHLYVPKERFYFVCLTFTPRPMSAQSSSVFKPTVRIP